MIGACQDTDRASQSRNDVDPGVESSQPCKKSQKALEGPKKQRECPRLSQLVDPCLFASASRITCSARRGFITEDLRRREHTRACNFNSQGNVALLDCCVSTPGKRGTTKTRLVRDRGLVRSVVSASGQVHDLRQTSGELLLLQTSSACPRWNNQVTILGLLKV